MDRLGIDIGSKTIKLVLLSGEDGTVLYSDYVRHRSRVKPQLVNVLRECYWECGPREVSVTVTGSAGMRVAELFGIVHVQEVVALKCAVAHLVPGCDCVLEMGGEDTKLVYLTGVPEQRMNNVCAGGTGGFIDMIASFMGVHVELLDSLAKRAEKTYHIASRCAVFAKSDVRPLLNAGARREDIAASVLEAVCTQAIAGLSAGRPIKGKVVLLGGAFNYIPALRDAFVRVSGLPEKDVIVPPDAHLFVAHGAALCQRSSAPMSLRTLVDQVVGADFSSEDGIGRLAPLFKTAEDFERFATRHERCRIPQVALRDASPNLFIGIDAGSTTMKLAVIDETGALCGYEYGWNHGDVTKTLPWMLSSQYGNIESLSAEKVVRRSCIVGYGEELCRTAYRVDMGEVETVAHLRAALELDPQVDFVLDIGGQDIKCLYVEDGAITDIVLNEACSSGCGSLFDDIARSMKRTKEGFASEALFAKSPVDLGTRCSTFMDSRVKHAQKDGVSAGDIAAGVAYATARNALYKVVRRSDFTSVGEHVVVQGGAFANDALLRAFELECGCEVKRPDLAEIMGAWGAALLARDEWLALRKSDPARARRAVSGLLTSSELSAVTMDRTSARCSQCTNACELTITRFGGEGEDGDARVYVMGNRCEKGALAYGAQAEMTTSLPNMFRLKRNLLAGFERAAGAEGPLAGGCVASVSRPVIGIPMVLALYESFPFWATLFSELGFAVRTGGASDDALYRAGMSAIPSEGACYPSKIVYGHVARLLQQGVELVFLPFVTTTFVRSGLAEQPDMLDRRECPFVEMCPQMVADNMSDDAFGGLRLVSPDLRHVHGADQLACALSDALAATGHKVAQADMERAIQAAQAKYDGFTDALENARERILSAADSGECAAALLCGHPYHTDLGICQGVDLLLGKMGYAVLDQLPACASAGDAKAGAKEDVRRYAPNARLASQIRSSVSHSHLQFVVLRSFGCGIDALVADEAYNLLHGQGRVYAELKLDQIVDLAGVRIRLRSLAYAMRQRNGEVQRANRAEWQFMDDERAECIDKAYEAYLERVAREGSPIAHGAAAIKRAPGLASRLRRSVVAGKAGGDVDADDAAHKEQVMLMRNFGYLLVENSGGGDAGVIAFKGKGAMRKFSSWDEVDAFLAERSVEAERRGARIKKMEDLGYKFVGIRMTLLGTTSYIGFIRENEVVWFDDWDQVADYERAHLGDADTSEASAHEGIPPLPPPPGVTAKGRVAGLSGTWREVAEYAEKPHSA